MTWSEGLTPAQEEVAGAAVGHARLLAGPGTGKTHVLVRRAEFLLEALPDDQTLLALTFTRAAAAEMRERLAQRLGDAAERVKVSTLHAYALGQLMTNRTTYLPQPLRIAGDWEERHIVQDELKHLTGKSIKEVQDALRALANDWDTLTADLQGWEERYADPGFHGAWLTHRDVYGYTLRSELVYQFLNELRGEPGLVPRTQPQVILVDEYQDLNRCDLNTVRELVRRCAATVFGVGDDDQSIYSFRQAAPAGIRDFQQPEFYPGADDLRLTECLRCGPEVVALATWVIDQELGRTPKVLTSVSGVDDSIDLIRFGDQHEEAVGIASLIDAEITTGTRPEDILVLFRKDRSGRVSQALDEQLYAAGHLAYRPRLQETQDEDLVRLQMYLQLATTLAEGDVDHLSLRALLELEDNRVGRSTILRVVDLAIEQGRRFADAIDLLRSASHGMGQAARTRLCAAVDDIYGQARELAPLPTETLDAFVERVAAQLQVEEASLVAVRHAMASRTAVEPGLVPDPRQLVGDLLLALNGLADTVPPAVPGNVTLTTMHAAKGLTADVVVVCQLEDEELPGGDADQATQDEARRLLYVSLTRARRRLVLSHCGNRTGAQGFGRGGPRAARQDLTRFLRGRGLKAQTLQSLLGDE